jgi:hypothetical protein
MTSAAASIGPRRKVERSFHPPIDVGQNFVRDVEGVLSNYRKLRFVRSSEWREIARCGKSVKYLRLS